MEKDYRYRLGKKRGRCPACGHLTFKFYLDTRTGEILDPTCGRCNREVNCRYHKPPSELEPGLREHPELPHMYECSEISPLVFSRSLRLDPACNSLLRYLATLFGLSRARRAMQLMDVGSARAFGGSPVFWLRDRQGRVRSGKVIAYDPLTGHRVKASPGGKPTTGWAHTLLGYRKFRLASCFFGEYRAALHPERKIVLVESEKTALMLKAAMLDTPDENLYEPLATGGAANLFAVDTARMASDPTYRLNILYRRSVIIVPDADMVARWRATKKALTPYCNSVELVDVTRPPYSLHGSDDIADYLAQVHLSDHVAVGDMQ